MSKHIVFRSNLSLFRFVHFLTFFKLNLATPRMTIHSTIISDFFEFSSFVQQTWMIWFDSIHIGMGPNNNMKVLWYSRSHLIWSVCPAVCGRLNGWPKDNINRMITKTDDLHLVTFSFGTFKCDHIKWLLTLTSDNIKRLITLTSDNIKRLSLYNHYDNTNVA